MPGVSESQQGVAVYTKMAAAPHLTSRFLVNVADFFSKLLEKGLFTMHAHRFGMNFEETIVGKLTELYQTVHLKEFTDFPKKDEKDPTTVFTDIHFEKKSIAHEAYHLSHGYCQ